MTPSAQFVEILWTLAHLVGLVAALGLVAITWRRRAAVFSESDPRTPKGPRIRVANRQLRDRGGRSAFHLVAMILGLLAMADAPWIDAAAGWVLFGISALIVMISVIDLSEEVAR
jgi:hypothetical protein